MATTTIEAVERFNEALNQQDFDALGNAVTEDCVFEDTGPRPDGERYRGRDAVVGFFRELFENSPESRLEVEELFACEDRCVVRWNHHWTRDDEAGNNRGVDFFRVRDGKVAEKLAYTKHG